LLFLLIFFIACNFCKLLFIIEGGKVIYLFFNCLGEGVHLDFFKFFYLLLRGRGVEVNVFFLLFSTCGRGRGLVFFFKFFFHCY
jgi:hypothetical protein